MPTQDKDTKMAIPSEPKNLARKIMNTDLSAYAMGKAAKEGIKKFVAKHPVVVTDYPADDAESNNARFKGDKVKKDDATRKADYKTGEDEKAYESVIKRKLIEKFVAKISNTKLAQKETEGLETSEPAKKMAVVSTNKPIVSRVSDIGAGRKEYNVKVVKSNEETIAEGGDPMSASPATSDNPGWSGESTSSGDEGSKEKEKTGDPDKEGDEENDETETVKEVREYLENIAMMSAEMFENLQDDAELDKWVVEKLELAHDFIEAVSKEINDSKGNVDDEEDEEEGNQGGKDDNNNAKPSAFKGNGEQSMAKEEVELDEGNSTKDYFRHLHRINELGGKSLYDSKRVKEHIQNHVPTDVLKSIHRNMPQHQHSDLFAAEIARRKANPDIKIKRVPKMDPHSEKKYVLKGVAGYHEEVELDEATVPAPIEDDEGYYTHKEIHGKNAVSREDWKKGIRKPKAPVKESALGDALGSEEGVKKSTVKKDEYDNEVKHPARSLARKAMKKFATKKGA